MQTLSSAFDDLESTLEMSLIPPPLSASVLTPNSVFVLDCVVEIFLWLGPKSSQDLREAGQELVARIVPLQKRPKWISLHRIIGGVEPEVFKLRFNDFPNPKSVKQLFGLPNTKDTTKNESNSTIKVDVAALYEPPYNPDDLDTDTLTNQMNHANDLLVSMMVFTFDKIQGKFVTVKEEDKGYLNVDGTYIILCVYKSVEELDASLNMDHNGNGFGTMKSKKFRHGNGGDRKWSGGPSSLQNFNNDNSNSNNRKRESSSISSSSTSLKKGARNASNTSISSITTKPPSIVVKNHDSNVNPVPEKDDEGTVNAAPTKENQHLNEIQEMNKSRDDFVEEEDEEEDGQDDEDDEFGLDSTMECVVYFWKGPKASLAALTTFRLKTQKEMQALVTKMYNCDIRVVYLDCGREPVALLAHWGNCLVIRKGGISTNSKKSNSSSSPSQQNNINEKTAVDDHDANNNTPNNNTPLARMYQIRTDSRYKTTRAFEVEPVASSLISEDCFLVIPIQNEEKEKYLWMGRDCSKEKVRRAINISNKILGGDWISNLPSESDGATEFGLRCPPGVIKIDEKSEGSGFWNLLGGKGIYASSPISNNFSLSNMSSSSLVLSPRKNIVRYFRCSCEPGYFQVESLKDIWQDDLKDSSVIIIDPGSDYNVFMWIGRGSSDVVRKLALKSLEVYFGILNDGRTIPVDDTKKVKVDIMESIGLDRYTRLQHLRAATSKPAPGHVTYINSGSETKEFKAFFLGWDDHSRYTHGVKDPGNSFSREEKQKLEHARKLRREAAELQKHQERQLALLNRQSSSILSSSHANSNASLYSVSSESSNSNFTTTTTSTTTTTGMSSSNEISINLNHLTSATTAALSYVPRSHTKDIPSSLITNHHLLGEKGERGGSAGSNNSGNEQKGYFRTLGRAAGREIMDLLSPEARQERERRDKERARRRSFKASMTQS